MRQKPLVPLTVNELHHLLKKHRRFRKDLERLRLKLTVSGRLVGTKKSSCVPPDFHAEADPLILPRRASKRRK